MTHPLSELDLQTWVQAAQQAFEQAHTPAQLENTKAHYLGKTGLITQALKSLSQCANLEDKKNQGAAINQAKQAIELALTTRRQVLAQAQLEAELATQAIDVTLPGRGHFPGSLHPVCATLERIESIFGAWGFEVTQGPEIETDWFNFTALNTPEDHPARSMHDTFYLEGGYLLRTHTSPLQIRYVREQITHHQDTHPGTLPEEVRVIAHGRTYRVDSDATHSPMFHQCEGLWLAPQVSFADLKSVFTGFCYAFFETDALQLRFRQSFFPFTEPSAEIDLQFQTGPLAGKWLEIAGAGQVHPQVIVHMGLDPQIHQGFAFGVGADRLTMLRHGVDDLRLFFENDLRFLNHFGQAQRGAVAGLI
jgi:phenylalanyl-tRNA synthetase alpha chain